MWPSKADLNLMQMYPVPPNAKYGGATDRYIGEWIKGIQRDKIILATKVVYISCTEMSSRFAFTIHAFKLQVSILGKLLLPISHDSKKSIRSPMKRTYR